MLKGALRADADRGDPHGPPCNQRRGRGLPSGLGPFRRGVRGDFHHLGLIFGDRALVARAKRSGVEGIAVVDLDAVQWRSTEKRARPVGVDEMYYIYKGRKLLRNFNE